MKQSLLKTIPLLSNFTFDEIKLHRLAGLTNKNYLITITTAPKQQYILRIPQRSTNRFINRDSESYNAEIAQQLGIAPKCLWRGEGEQEGVSLTEFINHTKHFKSDNQASIESFAKSLISLHRSKKPFKGTLDNKKIATLLKQYFKLCSANQQKQLKTDYQKGLSLLTAPLCKRPSVPSHIDLVVENILQQDDKIWFIDWEYSAMASPLWDIAIFCHSAGLDSSQSKNILKRVLSDYHTDDLLAFEHYRFITQLISNCWHGAFDS